MVVVDPESSTTSSKKRREEMRDELARLETPHITDVKSALLDSFALGLHTKGLSSLDRLTYLREACELGMFQLFNHSLICKCEIPDEMRLTDDTFTDIAATLEGIQVPHMAYYDVRDRAAGLKRSTWSIPDLGKSFESSSEPERQPLLSERTEEAVAHRILNGSMIRAAMFILGLLQVHGIVPYEEEEPTLDIGIETKPQIQARPIRELPPGDRAAVATAILPERRKAAPVDKKPEASVPKKAEGAAV